MSRDGDTAGATPAPQPDATPGSTSDEPLGEGGKKALDEERKARREAERRLREVETAQTRRQVAADKGLTDAQARYLTGDTRDELEASADELQAAFKSPVKSRPQEDLREGAVPGAGDTPDSAAMADRIIGRD